MAVSGADAAASRICFQSSVNLDLSSGISLIRRAEHAADTLRVDDREGGIDQVFLLHLFALDDDVLQQREELHLPTAQCGVGADELVEGGADFIREALQHFDAEDMTDELDKARLAVLINLAQQVFGDVRMRFMQQFSQFMGFLAAHCFAVLVLRSQPAGDADGFVLRPHSNPFFLCSSSAGRGGFWPVCRCFARGISSGRVWRPVRRSVFIRLGRNSGGFARRGSGLAPCATSDRRAVFADCSTNARLSVRPCAGFPGASQRDSSRLALKRMALEVSLGTVRTALMSAAKIPVGRG
ncbi:hypothetical protein FQR65_LT20709 [Abscondita terminalis]|nr:hypothetical protein FQR65_LT20709 [Abscondita terminalis]